MHMVSHYCKLFEKVRIVTKKGIKFIDDVPETEDDEDDNKLAKYNYKLSSKHCLCGKQLFIYQEKYCSNKCRFLYNKPKAPDYRVCPVCKEIKLFKLKKQMFCSKACAGSENSKKRNHKNECP